MADKRLNILVIENRIIAAAVGVIACIIKHQHTVVARRSSHIQLMEANSYRKFQPLGGGVVFHLLEEWEIDLFGFGSPVAINLKLVNRGHVVGLRHFYNPIHKHLGNRIHIVAQAFFYDKHHGNHLHALGHRLTELQRGVWHQGIFVLVYHHIKIPQINLLDTKIVHKLSLRAIQIKHRLPKIHRRLRIVDGCWRGTAGNNQCGKDNEVSFEA